MNDTDKRIFTTKQYKQKWIYMSTSTLQKNIMNVQIIVQVYVWVSGYYLGVYKYTKY